MYTNLKIVLTALGLMGSINVFASEDIKQDVLPYGFRPHALVSIAEIYNDYQPSSFPKPRDETAVRLYVTSEKTLKIKAAERIMVALGFKVASVCGVKTKSGVAEQPVGKENGLLGAINRIKSLESIKTDEAMDMIVSIENFMDVIGPNMVKDADEACVDIAAIVIKDAKGCVYQFLSDGVLAPIGAYNDALRYKQISPEGKDDPTGFPRVVADFLKDQNPQIESTNWQPLFTSSSKSREDIIVGTFRPL